MVIFAPVAHPSHRACLIIWWRATIEELVHPSTRLARPPAMRRILFLFVLLGLIVAGCASAPLEATSSTQTPSQTVSASADPTIAPTTPPTHAAATPTSP